MMCNYFNADDEAIVETVISGDSDAYSEIVKRYKNRIFSICLSIVGNYYSAEDITQETFVEGYLKLSSLKDKEKLYSWLCRIARNKSYNHLVRSPNLYEYELLESIPDADYNSPEQVALKHDMQNSVAAALGRLTEKTRTVAILFYFREYSQKKIAQLLDIPEGTVKRRLYDAREKLKKEIDFMENNTSYKLPESFDEKVSVQIQALKNYYHLKGNSYVGFDEYFKETLNMIEKMPETIQKHSAYAYAYFIASRKNTALKDEARKHAELGNNAAVICSILIDELINGDNDYMIRRITEYGIPKMEAIGAKNEKGELLFWRSAGYLKKDEYEKAKTGFTDSLNFLNQSNAYYANACAGICALEALQSNDCNIATSTGVICGEGVRYNDGKLYFENQPGFGYKNISYYKSKYRSIYYHATRCNDLFFDENMKVGDTCTSKNGSSTLTLEAANDTITVVAGTFTDCIKLKLKEDYIAEIWYAKGVGLVRINFSGIGAEENYELCEYCVSGGKGDYMPLCIGNVWRYINTELPDFYHQLIERKIITFDGEIANFSAVDLIWLGKEYETSPEADSDLFINRATIYCEDWKIDDAIHCLKIAAQKNSGVKANSMAIAGLDYLERFKNYQEKKYRFLPSGINGSDLVKSNGKIIYSEGGSYSFGPYRWGSRHEENKIFGMKPFRFLQILTGCIFSDKWVIGYKENKNLDENTIAVNISIDDGGIINVKAGRFENCLKLTIEAELENDDKSYYWQNYSFVHCGKKIFYFAPNVGLVKHICEWGGSLSSICELSEYSSVATNGEYMPIYVGCRWIYDEMTLENGYRARRKFDITYGTRENFFMIDEQEFLYLGTEEEYEDMKIAK
jgi:RNA polymerase sigma-70 factor (ECF subfamily)